MPQHVAVAADPEVGAIIAVILATLGDDGETGTFSSKDGTWPR